MCNENLIKFTSASSVKLNYRWSKMIKPDIAHYDKSNIDMWLMTL